MDLDYVALRDRYSELIPVERAPEGHVCQATAADGTPVTVLVIAPELVSHLRDAKRFEDALRHAARFRHEGISALRDFGRTDGSFFCAYTREDWRDMNPGYHSSSEIAAIGSALARALHALHATGRVHGAVSTRQIKVTSRGAARLGGLGLMSALVEGGVSARHASTELCDAAFVSPERDAGELPSASSDLYALGASLYELLTGKAPFGGRTTSFVMATVLPEEPTSDGRGITPADRVIAALLRAIEREPDDRWPSAAAFANALEAAAADPFQDRPGDSDTAALGRLRSKFAAIFQGAWFRPDGRGRNSEESPGSTGQTAR